MSIALRLLGVLVEAHHLRDDALHRIARSLPIILEEYRYDQTEMETPSIAEVPGVRREVHRLSILLVNSHSELAELSAKLEVDPLPEVRSVAIPDTGDSTD